MSENSAEPHFSVVVPVFDGGEVLRTCLEAVLASDCPAFEVIVVDDGSTDGSGEVARGLGCTVLQQPNRGPASARNAGVARARGEHIVLLDADVIVGPQTLASLARYLEQRPEVVGVSAVYSATTRVDSFGAQYLNLKQRAFQLGLPELADTAWTACFMVRRSAWEACEGMDERTRLPAADDLVLGCRLTRGGERLAFAHAVEVEHVKPLSPWGVLRFHLVHAREWAMALERYGDLAPQKVGQSRRPVGNTLLATALVLGLPLLALGELGMWSLVAGLLLGAIWNAVFLAMLARHRGVLFALACLPLVLAEALANAVGLVWGRILGRLGATSSPLGLRTDEGQR